MGARWRSTPRKPASRPGVRDGQESIGCLRGNRVLAGCCRLDYQFHLPRSLPRPCREIRLRSKIVSFADARQQFGVGTVETLRVAAVKSEFTTAKETLDLRWLPQDFRPAVTAEEEPRVAVTVTKPTATDGVPLPRSRPAAADQLAQTSQVVALASAVPTTIPTMTSTDSSPPRPAERSTMQKFSEW